VILAIASGKGGTGKTTVALSLARTLTGPVELLDCDVEAPDDHLFLHPEIDRREDVTVPVPVVEDALCSGCGECSDLCAFNAIVTLGARTLVFPELCHSCRGCARVCPTGAITEVPRRVGVVEVGRSGRIRVVQGRLEIGESLVPPVIGAVRAAARGDGTVLVDAPPGTSCAMVEAVRGADAALLVAEPTPFGLNDLELAAGAMDIIGVPHAVAVNRAGIGDDRVHRFCAERGIPILAEIPDDRRVAEASARGEIISDAVPDLRPVFEDLGRRFLDLAGAGRGADVPEAV
jgi:MinD superfamily P-loop ATPase